MHRNSCLTKPMQYLYSFANASLISHVIRWLSSSRKSDTAAALQLGPLTAMYLVDRWVLCIRLAQLPTPAAERDLMAVLEEYGIPHAPSPAMRAALRDLALGETPTRVMETHQVVVVSHGHPDLSKINDFRVRFVKGLGYCPETLV